MNKETILFNVDVVFCLKVVNDFMETNYVIDDFTNYYIDEVTIPKDKFLNFNKFVMNRNLYDDFVILPNIIEFLKI